MRMAERVSSAWALISPMSSRPCSRAAAIFLLKYSV